MRGARRLSWGLAVLALVSSAEAKPTHPTARELVAEAWAGGLAAVSQPESCGKALGPVLAGRLVHVCVYLSPAIHPPCNAANACGMIVGEILRSCPGTAAGALPCETTDPMAPKPDWDDALSLDPSFTITTDTGF